MFSEFAVFEEVDEALTFTKEDGLHEHNRRLDYKFLKDRIFFVCISAAFPFPEQKSVDLKTGGKFLLTFPGTRKIPERTWWTGFRDLFSKTLRKWQR